MKPNFDLIFPSFLTAVFQLRDLLLPVAFVLIVTGFVLSVANAGQSVRRILTPIVRVTMLTALLVYLPVWGGELSKATNDAIVHTLKANPAEVNAKFRASLQAQNNNDDNEWWANLFKASYFESIISGLLFLLGMLAGVIVFYAYITQTFVLYVGYGLSPIFIGFLGIRGLSSIGSNYLLGLTGVICWPLGWACASLLTDGLIAFLADRSILSLGAIGSIGYGFQNLIGVAAIALWLIVSTITAPVIIQKAIAHGAQVGGAFLSTAMTGGVAAATSGATTAGAIAAKLSEPAKPGTEASGEQKAGAGVTGAFLGATAAMTALVGSSLSGSTYSPTASMVGTLGGMLKPPKKKHNPDDPANDREVEEMLNRSRS